jgi:methyltransferase (TIGR00027 family)
MAVQRGLESCRPPASRLFEDPLCRRFVSPRWRAVLTAARVAPVRVAVERLYDRVAGPGPRASAVARTRLIDDLLADLAPGAEQVVILGAGLDGRAQRLGALAGRRAFEVDHPDTQAFKRQRAGSLGVDYVPVDFERDALTEALRQAGFDPARRSVFLWEGVTNYLTDAAVAQTLAAIGVLAAPASTLIFTYVDRAALDPERCPFPEAARWLKGVARRGEPWIFGLDPASVGESLAGHGLTLTGDLSTAQAGERYFPGRGRRERGSGLYHVATAART